MKDGEDAFLFIYLLILEVRNNNKKKVSSFLTLFIHLPHHQIE